MSSYCSAPLDLASNHDVIGACIQAEAGFAQARAALNAGYWTAGAGAFALAAAIITAAVAISITRRQIAAAQAEQEKQRSHELKRQVFSTAMSAIGACFESIGLLANLTVPVAEAHEAVHDKDGSERVGHSSCC